MNHIHITLPLEQINIILRCLSRQPFSDVEETIVTLRGQVQEHIAAQRKKEQEDKEFAAAHEAAAKPREQVEEQLELPLGDE